jgi:membrane protein implicated in regulation of membrane protease activity
MSSLFDYFATFGSWNWLIFAGVMLALELVAPGIYLMWFGMAALLTGLIAFTLPIAWQYQLILFAVLSLAALFGARRWAPTQSGDTDRPWLNQRARQYVGQSFLLAEAIVDGRGKAQVGDTLWSVTGEDAPQGSVVKVTGADGNVLLVEPAQRSG